MELEYNSGRNQLVIPEYGRNIQKMIEYACTIEDREERNKIANAIVNAMSILNPHMRELTDYKNTLWDHLFVISNYKLDVDSPYPKPSPEDLHTKPQPISYPENKIKFRHYGKNIEKIITKIVEVENEEEKEYMKKIIANFMKMSYLSWNRDSVDDEVIFEHLRMLSDGNIVFDDSAKLNESSDLISKAAKGIGGFKQGLSKPGRTQTGNGWKKSFIRKSSY